MIIGEDKRRAVMLSAVTRIDHSKDFKQAAVHTTDGEVVTYDSGEIETALEHTVQASFPAEGAVQLVTEHDEKMKPTGEVWRRAILGFFLDGSGDLRAVTVDANVSDAVILFADGHVEAFENRWETLEEYQEHLREKERDAADAKDKEAVE